MPCMRTAVPCLRLVGAREGGREGCVGSLGSACVRNAVRACVQALEVFGFVECCTTAGASWCGRTNTALFPACVV
jgi:hypothetical protein